jgi:hypothetical protein
MWKRKKLDAVSDDVIAGLRRWLASDRFARGIIPNPATFLNQERWKDAPPAAPPELARKGEIIVRELSAEEKVRAEAEQNDWREFQRLLRQYPKKSEAEVG